VTGSLRIGEVANRAGVNIQTLRYYERRGLLAQPQRRASGQRRYPQTTVAMIRTIKNAQRLGFTLNEIEELLVVSSQHPRTNALRRRATAKLAEIDDKIAQLHKMRTSLVEVLDADCDSLTDCSCGRGCPLPVVQLAPIGGPGADTT